MKTVTTGIDWCWYRFREYMFDENEGSIQPVDDDAVIRYNPWEAYWDWRANVPEVQPPYMPLFELVRETEDSLRRMVQSHGADMPSRTTLKQWCQWFAGHGLLGILPHGLRQITHGPVWRRPVGEKNSSKLAPTVITYSRTNGDWLQTEKVIALDNTGSNKFSHTRPREHAKVFGDNVPARWRLWIDVHEGIPFGPGVVHCSGEDAEDYLSDFILLEPGGGDVSHIYPLPLTDAFWRCYREPLNEIFRAVLVLHDATVGALNKDNATNDCTKLNVLLDEASMRLQVAEDGTYRCMYSFPSLLASFACMIALDLEEQRRVFSCPECQKLFCSHAYQSSYCSPRCRNRANTREFRLRQKAIRLKAEGASDNAVAEELGVTIQKIREWWTLLQPRNKKK